MSEKDEQQVSRTLDEIKRLLILGLVQQGVQGKRVAEVLGVDPGTVSRLLSPKRTTKG